MNKGQTVLLVCQISRSGFSGERVFRLTLADGTEYVGVAPVDYCYHPDKSPLGTDDPPQGQRIDGLVEGRVIENGGRVAKVAMPDGEVIEVSLDRIPFGRSKQTDYVPLGS
jgi:hypothetical protein